ncbi:MAG: ABC transporter permease [Actinomycetota bacterium]
MIEFFTDPEHWSGPMGIPFRLYEHFIMSFQTVLVGALIATPVGIYIGHTRRFEFLAISVGNIGRALPSFGIVALVYVYADNLPGNIGFWPTFIALVLLAIPPIMLNTYAGVKGVDRDTLEAARGMGMTEREVLQAIELPLATPLILDGLRTAAVQVVATATLGAYTGWGGLGAFIRDGFAVRDFGGQLLAGAVLVAAFALATEGAFGLLTRWLSPKTTSRGRRRAPGAELETDEAEPIEPIRAA